MSLSRVFKSPPVSESECLISLQPSSGHALPAEPANLARDADVQKQEAAYAAGFQAGQLDARRQMEPTLRAWQELQTVLDTEVEQFFCRLEIKTVDVILAMVRKIVGAKTEIDPDIVRESVRKVLARRQEPGEMLTLRLHPEDFQRIAPAETVTPRNLKMVPDDGIARGGCVLENRFGLIDAQLESQMTELEKRLRQHIAAGHRPSQIMDGLKQADEIRSEGRVVNIVGTVIESRGPNTSVGEHCEIVNAQDQATMAEVIGFKENQVLLMPLGERHGIGPGSRVIARGQTLALKAGPGLLGRVINGLGQPIDNLGPLTGDEMLSPHGRPNNPMQRRPIREPLYTGVKAIDGILTCGKGGRMGIFAGSGVGKSVLLGMMARNTSADVNVIALIGERGREVREFIERDLGEEGLKKSVVVAVTSDESPVLRIHGAQLAASLAEYFSRRNQDVLFMMDSVTRFAMAHREVGLAAGEPPATKGYTPSTFAALPKLLERSGVFDDTGSITGFYAVLVEGDDMDEPVADHVRSILDGHIVLSRALFSQNHFPAIDVLSSISRLSKQVCTAEQHAWAAAVRDDLATVHEIQDLLNLGAYVRGNNGKIDQALGRLEAIQRFLKQAMDAKIEPDAMWRELAEVAHRG